jgi:sterol desaturase/sphingolipid hydroxylase (fatty acid hydroxylase superfamily)
MLELTAIGSAPEFIAPLEKPSWSSRLRGIQMTAAKAAAAAILLASLNSAWSRLGIQPIDLGPIFGSGPFAGIAGAVLAIIFYDFLAYWHHRFTHRFYWPVHAAHHSIRELSAFNSYGHFAERVTEFALIAVPVSLIQWDVPSIPYFIFAAVQVMAVYIHCPTTAQLGPLAAVFVCPRFHRIHHSLEPRHFDKNFGIFLTCWDVMFGTAYWPRPDEWPDTGVADVAEPASVLQYAAFPLTFISRRMGRFVEGASS